jgi:hypothetical protein
LQYTSITISAGTLTVPSGLVLRATGNVSITGQIAVSLNPYAGQGIASGPPLVDWVGGTLVAGGGAISAVLARTLVSPGIAGGGSGYLFFTTSPNNVSVIPGYQPNGGGTIVILAAGTITINSGGSIHADGGAGSPALNEAFFSGGGGGGGIIVLASGTSVTASSGSTLSAVGGIGGAGNGTASASGGGGGGVINLLGPSVTTTGSTLSVGGGAGGTDSSSPEGFGSGGGGSGGAGGHSGNGSNGGTGSTGQTFSQTIANPSTLFVGGPHVP